MDSQQHQQQHTAHMATAAAWQVPPHSAYMMAAPPGQPAVQAYQQQYSQHPGVLDHSLSHAHHHHVAGHPPPPPPPLLASSGTHSQGYGIEPHGGSGGSRRSPPPYRGSSYRDRSYSPPPRHHRRSPSPRGYRDSRGYDRDLDYRGYDRGYDRGYERGYDREDRYDRSDSGYDRGYSRGYDRYERGYDREYDRGYGHHDRSGYRGRSPPRRSRTVNRGTEEDRLASRTLYVGNIPYSFREPDVESMFKKFGTIVKVTVVLDQYTGRNKGFAFVEYEDRKDAEEALEQYNGFDVHGRRLKLDWDIGLVKKDIKPSRSAGTTAENSTAETSPQPQTRTVTEASTPVEGEHFRPLDASAAPAKDTVDAAAYKTTDEPIQQSLDSQQSERSTGQGEDLSETAKTQTGAQLAEQQPVVQNSEQHRKEPSQQQQ